VRDGLGHLHCGHAVQPGGEVPETLFAVQFTAGPAARLGDTVREQDQAVAGVQQAPRVMQLRIGVRAAANVVTGAFPGSTPTWQKRGRRPFAKPAPAVAQTTFLPDI
jgi:hypothetical protein